MRTVPSVFRVQHVACPLLDGVIAARLATRRPRGPGRIVALDRFRRVPGAGSPRRIGIVPRGVTVHKAAFHFAEFPWTPVTTVRWMSQNCSTFHAETFAASGIAWTSLPVRSLAVLFEVRRVVGVDDRLISDRNVGEFTIFTAGVQTIFTGHEVIIVPTASRKE